MTFRIRPFDYSDDDYKEFIDLYNAVWTDHYDTVEIWRFHDERRVPGFLYERFVAEQEGHIRGVASTGQSPGSFVPGKFWLQLLVDPQWRRRGIGTAMYDHVLGVISPKEPKKLTTWTKEDQPDGIAFLDHRGFRSVMRYPESELDITTFDAAPFAEKVSSLLSSDLQVKSLTELLEIDPDCRRKLHDLIWELLQDVPSSDPFTRFPQDVWEKRTFENPYLLREGWRLALNGEQYVGLTMLFRNAGNEKILETGLTGVIRSHRRRGIATALKVLAFDYARTKGYELVRTDNEENNPMFQINLAMGFKPKPAELEFAKHLVENEFESAGS